MRLRHLPILLILLSSSVSGQDIALVGQILFVADRDGNPEVYVMDSDGANQTIFGLSVSIPIWCRVGEKSKYSDNPKIVSLSTHGLSCRRQ